MLEAATIDAQSHDWTLDPYSRGAYSYPLVGGADAAPALAAPLGDTLFFAGEFTCPAPANGTVEGAIDSGRRAAGEALRSLDRRVPRRAQAPQRGGA
jgi:monoamine oxidase